MKATRDMNRKVANVAIKAQHSVKYLGAYLVQCHTVTTMANTCNVTKKVTQYLKFLYRKAELLSFREHVMMCNALIQPVFDYISNS